MSDYNTLELMICLAARELEDGSSIFVGTGAPCAASMLAQRMHAPHLLVIFEAGGVGALLPTMPVSVGDSRTYYRGVAAGSMSDVMDACQRGMIDYSFLGCGQIDKFGNINSTCIGSHDRPQVRLPGSGGANDLASLSWRTMVITPQTTRRFVEKVDFLTTPGFLGGPGSREEAGLPPGTGPHRVVTNLCVIAFDDATKRMKVERIHPGVTREQVIENTGFELLWDDDLSVSDPPTDEELHILRTYVDPQRYIIGRE
jgi:glutaconate CoA-transferase, subunit B